MRSKRRSRVRSVFIGNYLDEQLQKERGLPAPNPAGSNRMFRLSKALETTGYLPFIVSAGCSARIRFSKRLIHPTQIQRKNGVVVIYAAALAIPYLSMLFELLSMSWLYLRLTFTRRIGITLLYCYYPSTVLVGLLAKLKGIRLVEDLEDIVTPKFSDFFKKSLLISLQQTLGGLLMRTALMISDLIIIPSSGFEFKRKESYNVLVVDGCIDVKEKKKGALCGDKITVMFAGMLDEEQGVILYLDTLALVNQDVELYNRLRFVVCGLSFEEEILKASLSGFTNLDLTYYGFVNSAIYLELLDQATICLVLQNPSGRNANQKTPSKGYEYLADGKVIIVSSIGDYKKLPSSICLRLKHYRADEVYSYLRDVNQKELIEIGEQAKEYAKLNWSFEKVGKRIVNGLVK